MPQREATNCEKGAGIKTDFVARFGGRFFIAARVAKKSETQKNYLSKNALSCFSA